MGIVVRYNSGRRSQREGVLVVAISRSTGEKAGMARAAACKKVSGTSRSSKREGPKRTSSAHPDPFDVHPRAFRNRRLIWELYKASRG